MVAIDGQPLVELGPITDVWIAGADRVEILGNVFRTVYFKWKMIDGIWRRVAIDFATIRQLGADQDHNPDMWGVPIVELSGARSLAMAH